MAVKTAIYVCVEGIKRFIGYIQLYMYPCFSYKIPANLFESEAVVKSDLALFHEQLKKLNTIGFK